MKSNETTNYTMSVISMPHRCMKLHVSFY